MGENHQHHSRPSRCCSDEPAADVLKRLHENAPHRLGYMTPNGWSGESEDSFAVRFRAWTEAVEREQELARQGK